MGSINERIKFIMNELGYNNNSFAKALGVSPTVTFNIIGGRENKPSYEFIKKLILTFDNISPNWLIKGEGEMFSNEMNKPPQKQVIPEAKLRPEHDCTTTIEILREQLKVSNDTNKDLLTILKNMSERHN